MAEPLFESSALKQQEHMDLFLQAAWSFVEHAKGDGDDESAPAASN
jgi:hypothetical protein